jgi:hypothetical protein
MSTFLRMKENIRRGELEENSALFLVENGRLFLSYFGGIISADSVRKFAYELHIFASDALMAFS